MSARLDLVVYGATGFTGRLVCQYLRRHAPSGLRWAIAGRDAANLERVAHACESLPGLAPGAGASPCEVISGCASDGSAASRICGDLRPRVVLSTAGPFVHHSDALVAACARAGMSYVDINGEIPWVARVIERDDGPARESGALIVPNCGFDSVPSDLGALRATSLLAARTQSPCVQIQTVRFRHPLPLTVPGCPTRGITATGNTPRRVRAAWLAHSLPLPLAALRVAPVPDSRAHRQVSPGIALTLPPLTHFTPLLGDAHGRCHVGWHHRDGPGDGASLPGRAAAAVSAGRGVAAGAWG